MLGQCSDRLAKVSEQDLQSSRLFLLPFKAAANVMSPQRCVQFRVVPSGALEVFDEVSGVLDPLPERSEKGHVVNGAVDVAEGGRSAADTVSEAMMCVSFRVARLVRGAAVSHHCRTPPSCRRPAGAGVYGASAMAGLAR